MKSASIPPHFAPVQTNSEPASAPLAQLLFASAEALAAVHAGRSLTQALGLVNLSLRSGVQALTYYAMRHWGLACALRDHAVKKPLENPITVELLALSLLLLDVSMQKQSTTEPASPQTPYLDQAPVYGAHTLVDQSVQAARMVRGGQKPIGLEAQAKLVNAVLRRFQRERLPFLAAVQNDVLAAHAFPLWWQQKLKKQYPTQFVEIMHASRMPPQLMLRVNRRRATLDEVVNAFAEQGYTAQAMSDWAVMVQGGGAIDRMPGYEQGWWSVQDFGGQYAAPQLNLKPGMRVLDACAAPGGKTAHILEIEDVDLTAIDLSAVRLKRVTENLSRLGLNGSNVKVLPADVLKPDSWWNGQPFDVILADLPCSGSGVVKHHPDILWLRRQEDVANLAKQQKNMLDALWPLLKPSGHLLFVTCSIFLEEGERQIEQFLSRWPDAKRCDAPGILLPKSPVEKGQPGHDGFYYARIERQA
ncbi:MAG: 16S rRNA (cytosine(967)-C(5))-methyltransferase RsmB [Burkholderiaceae bacterium]|jgi:16S rRNA (cytosine967-C5)-methyltransferase|nr:16S rRNA (cytosine(967)-C(5))-methyltransferase RsmB [Burkholderiaceae bacterium]